MDSSYDDGLRGRTVIDGNGRVLGELDGIVIDTQSWRVSTLQVKLRKDVADTTGQQHGTFRAAVVEVPAEAVSGVGDTIVLNRAIESLIGQTAEASGAHAP